MNIALQTFLIILIFFPGYFFTKAYFRVEETELKFLTFSNKTVVAIIASLLFHTIVLSFLIIILGCNIAPRKYLQLILFTAHDTSIDAFPIRNREIFGTFLYIIFLSFLAYFVGNFFRYLIIKFNLDKRFSWLRFDNYWYYFFKAFDFNQIEPDLLEIVATVNLGEETYLYKGILEDYTLDRYGDLDKLIISSACRRDIKNDEDDIFYPIEGDYFLLKYTEILNMNVFFINLTLSNLH